MEVLGKKEICSVRIFQTRISEDELQVLLACAEYLHDKCPKEEVELITGATFEEFIGIIEDIKLSLSDKELKVTRS